MANGFRFKKFTYTGGSGKWDSNSTMRSRAETVLKDMAEWLVTQSETGWEYDLDFNADSSEIRDLPYIFYSTSNSWDSCGTAYDAPVLFFKNTTSKCKLMLAIQPNCYYSTGSSYVGFTPKTVSSDIFKISTVIDKTASVYYPTCAGVIMSIIPGNGDDTESFSDLESLSGAKPFLPPTATRLVGSVMGGYGYATTDLKSSYIQQNKSNYTYCYNLYVTPYVVGVHGCYSTTGSTPRDSIPFTYCGRIFGNLAHTETTPTARYGVLDLNAQSFTDEFSSYYYLDSTVSASASNNTGTSSVSYAQSAPFWNYIQGYNQPNCSRVQFFDAAGNVVQFVPFVCNCRVVPSGNESQCTYMNNTANSGLLRWCPYQVGVVSTDLNTYNVTPGDGFKGYLDTDLFRSARCTAYELYDDGNFIGMTACMLLGWNKDNEAP